MNQAARSEQDGRGRHRAHRMNDYTHLDPDFIAWDADRAAFEALGGWQTAVAPCDDLDHMFGSWGSVGYCGRCGWGPVDHRS